MPRPVAHVSRRSNGVSDFTLAGGLVLVAWLLRLTFLFSNRDRSWPFTIFYEGDSEAFYLYARALLSGTLYDGGIPFHPPGFAHFLAGLHLVLGAGAPEAQPSHLAVKIVLALVGSLAIGLFFWVARRYVGSAAAAIGGLLAACHFGLIVLAIAPVTESLYLLLLSLALLFWSDLCGDSASADKGKATRGWGTLLALGLTLAALVLVRAEGALAAAILLGLGALRAHSKSRALPFWRRQAQWILATAVCLLALTPNLFANHRALELANRMMGDRLYERLPTWVPVTLYGPLNLALANHSGADGGFSREHLPGGDDATLDLKRRDHLTLLLHGDREARAWIAAHPAEYAGLVVRKWTLFLGALRLGWTQWNLPGGLVGLRRPVDVFVPDNGIHAWLLGPALLLAFAAAWRAGGGPRRWALLTALLTAGGLATTALFFGYARQGLLLLPLWLPLLALGLVRAAEFAQGKWPLSKTTARRVGAAALIALCLVELWGATRDRDYEASGETLKGQSHLNRDRPMRLSPLP